MGAEPIVIVGAGHAGVQLAASLREEGYEGGIALVDGERTLPYQRPPLSKAFLKGEVTAGQIALRPGSFYAEKRVDLLLGETITALSRRERLAHLASGRTLAYSHLVLSTGSRPKLLALPGADLAGVVTLATLRDAEFLKQRKAGARQIVVIGAGFIGLEFAAVASAGGHAVTVLELAPRAMARAVSPPVSAVFEETLRASGTVFHFGVTVSALEGREGRVRGVALADGRRFDADLVLVGVGVLAQDALAVASGLDTRDGIVVDATLLTSDPHVSAVGDAAQFPTPYWSGSLRLGSVQNAHDQARCVARRLCGKPAAYGAVPWFWSDQADLKLQTVGLSWPGDHAVLRGDPASRAFSVFGFRDGALAWVESVNRAGDHMAGRRLIAANAGPTPAQAADIAFDLRAAAMQV